MKSAATEPLSLIIGPPGTGKSFTAAAIAVDHVLRGQSVVIAAKTPQALDVLSSKLEGLLGDRHLILRGGRGYMRDLTNSLGLWLEGGVEPIDIQLVQRLRKEMASQAKALARLEGALRRRAEWELQWGKDTAGRLQPGVLRRFARRYRIRITDWRLARQGDYWDLIEQYQQQLRAHHETIGKFVRASVRQQRQKTLHTHRREMVTLLKALRARTNRKQEEWFSRMDLSLLLRTFPVWLTPLADVGGLLPLKRELFDLAIMDEATQCDMAGCLPVFYRARRAIITGDPRQLRHLSFLSRERQRQLAGKWSLSERESDTCDYRQRSILDWVAESIPSQEQVVSLDEHFRSRPQIIAFSNREFYRNRLRVMTRRPDTLAAPGLSLRVVNGHRERNGPNRHEADQVVVEVVRHVESEKDLPANLAHSLGVLSPFREQVDFLYSRLSKTLSLKAIQKHRLRIGTAHSFQGEERDIMFLSFVADPQTHPAALRYLERPDVFNVSITRARSLQMIFSSIRPSDLPSGSLLRKYLESIDECPPITAEAVIDAFQEEVQTAMVSHGWQTWPGYVVAGVPVDLLIAKNARSLGIDLVGYPGHFAEAFDLEKYRLFERAGLRLFPLSFSAWRKAPQACIEAIERWLSAVCHTQWLPP